MLEIIVNSNISAIIKLSKMVLVSFSLCWLLYISPSVFQSNILNGGLAEGQQSPTTSKFVTYDGSKYGFSIQHPDNWIKKEDSSGIWFISPVDESGNLRIESQSIQNVSLKDLLQFQLLQSKDSYKEFKVVSSNMTTIDKSPANRTDYKFKVEVPKFMGADIYDYDAIKISTLKDDRLYTVTYFAPPDSFYIFLPIVQKMLGSLKIVEKPIVTQ